MMKKILSLLVMSLIYQISFGQTCTPLQDQYTVCASNPNDAECTMRFTVLQLTYASFTNPVCKLERASVGGNWSGTYGSLQALRVDNFENADLVNLFKIVSGTSIWVPGTDAGTTIAPNIGTDCIGNFVELVIGTCFEAGTALGPNACRTADVDVSSVTDEVSAYPNPISEGTLNFGKTAAKYSLFNSQGVLVAEGTEIDGIKVDAFTTGIYFLNIDGNTNKISIQ